MTKPTTTKPAMVEIPAAIWQRLMDNAAEIRLVRVHLAGLEAIEKNVIETTRVALGLDNNWIAKDGYFVPEKGTEK